MPNNTKVRVSDLKAAIDALPTRWRMNPRLHPGGFVPRYALGGDTAKLTRADQAPPIDLPAILKERSNNPFINARRHALGHLTEAPSVVPMVVLPALPGAIPTEGAAALPPEAGAVSPPPDAGTTPASVDWRTRWGWRWITTIQDQKGCNSCWAFSATALVESMARIEHAVWSKRSEGDVHDGIGKKCENLGNIGEALNWIKEHNGICDLDCYPYKTDDSAYEPAADRSGRTVKIQDYQWLGSVADQKKWLDAVGPLAACFTVWTDFFGYSSGVYRKTTATWNEEEGGHCILVVGYSDTEGCWICKNSWGADWGDNGYFKIAYGQVNIDTWSKAGLTRTNPDPWTKRRVHAGAMIESGNGSLHRNFEMIATSGSKFKHWWRDNQTSGFPWHGGVEFGASIAACPALTGTTFNRNFELVALTTTHRLHHWWFQQASPQAWHDGGVFGPTDAAGIPGFIQSDYGHPGNFEVVVRTADGKLNHWWRNNAWHDGGRFASNVVYSGPTLVQTRNRKLHVVCVVSGGQMQMWERNDSGGFVWSLLQTFGEGVGSPPCMIEGQYGAQDEKQAGNYELCVARGGKIEHWWRYNGGDKQWRRSATFGHDIRAVASLVEGSFGFNLEVIALRMDNKLQHYWRDGAGWHEGVIIGSI